MSRPLLSRFITIANDPHDNRRKGRKGWKAVRVHVRYQGHGQLIAEWLSDTGPSLQQAVRLVTERVSVLLSGNPSPDEQPCVMLIRIHNIFIR